MLARGNRIVTPDDFRRIVRRGSRRASPLAVYHLAPTDMSSARFGFIVSRAVGGATTRNRVRRRYRAIARELVDTGYSSADVVVRVHRSSAAASWRELYDDMTSQLTGERRGDS